MFGDRKTISGVVAGRLCLGCGACAWACPNEAIELRNFVDHGIRPVRDSRKCENCGDCLAVCSGVDLSHDRNTWAADTLPELAEGWGPALELWEGYATDQQIRFEGSSGGVATALALFCLENLGMSGVLHAGMDSDRPYLSRAAFSRTREELLQRVGSRYAPVAVCSGLDSIETAPGESMLLAKPCDIAAARKACALSPSLEKKLSLAVAIFCGGTPSTSGSIELLRQLGVAIDDVASLRYRGFGWPGNASAETSSAEGHRKEMSYQQAWDKILTRHRPLRCLMCPDGTGEFADIACGDPWYRPVKDGEKGTTLIVVRTHLGRKILREAIDQKYIVAQPCGAEVLSRSQPGLLNRRHHVWPKQVALRVMATRAPRFRGFALLRGWLRLRAGRKFVSFFRALRHAIGLRKRGALRFSPQQIQDSLANRPVEIITVEANA